MKKVLLVLLSLVPVSLMAQQAETETARRARMIGYNKTQDSIQAVFNQEPKAEIKEKILDNFFNSSRGKLNVFMLTKEIMQNDLAVAYAAENNVKASDAYLNKIKSSYIRADIGRKVALAFSKAGNQELAVKRLKPVLDSLLRENGTISDKNEYSAAVQAYVEVLKPGSEQEVLKYLKPLYVANEKYFPSDLLSNTGDDMKRKLFYRYATALPAATGAKEIAEVVSTAFQNGTVPARLQSAVEADFTHVPNFQKYLNKSKKAGKQDFAESVKKVFVKNDINGKTLSPADFKGKYVLLDFWGSWCLPCRATHPHLIEVYHKYKDKGFEIIGIARESATDLEKAKMTWKKAVAQDKVNWVHVLSNENITSFDPAIAFKISIFPTKILLDKEGNEIARYTGMASEAFDEKMKELFGF